MKPTIIACLGKGGTGKTVVSTLIGREYIRRGCTPLFVDADPVLGLQKTLGLDKVKSLAQARDELIDYGRRRGLANHEESAEALEYMVMNVLWEERDFGFIAMGQSRERGCFCPVNNLLRKALHHQISQFNPVIIDAEAGVEQVNRLVVDEINEAYLITDTSRRGVDTCLTIHETISRMEAMAGCTAQVIFNRTDRIPPAHEELLRSRGLPVAGVLPADAQVAEADIQGTSLLSLSADTPAQRALADLIHGEAALGKRG